MSFRDKKKINQLQGLIATLNEINLSVAKAKLGDAMSSHGLDSQACESFEASINDYYENNIWFSFEVTNESVVWHEFLGKYFHATKIRSGHTPSYYNLEDEVYISNGHDCRAVIGFLRAAINAKGSRNLEYDTMRVTSKVTDYLCFKAKDDE